METGNGCQLSESHHNYPMILIANELAEANRLKRIELKRGKSYSDPTMKDRCVDEKELEDQA